MKVQALFRILLIIIVLCLTVMAFRSIMRPEKFKSVYSEREKEIKNRLTTLRTAQLVYKMEHKSYAKNIDDLVEFVNNGTLTITKLEGSIPEKMSEADAFKLGYIKKVDIKVPAQAKILELDKNIKPVYFKNFQYIPENDGKKFEILSAKLSSNYEVYKIEVSLDEIFANMDRTITPPESNFFIKGINFVLYNSLEKEEQYRNLYKPMWLGSLNDALTTGSWE
jgi:hypothetical protein